MPSDDRLPETTTGAPTGGGTTPPSYEIRVEGRLGARWATWFDGLTVEAQEDGTTVITGTVVDQAALHGVLHRLRDMGIPLVSLTQVVPDDPGDAGPHGHPSPGHPSPGNPSRHNPSGATS